MSFNRLLLCACLTFATGFAAAQVPEFEEDADVIDAAQADATMAANQAWQRRTAEALAASGRARDVALAALLLQAAGGVDAPEGALPDDNAPSREIAVDPRIATWRQQAVARATGDVLVDAMLAGTQASTTDAASVTSAASRWRTAEPDNLVPLLFGNQDANRVLADASRTARFDVHYYDQARAIATALRTHLPSLSERALLQPAKMPDYEFAAMMASSMVSAFAIPSLATLSTACRDSALDATPGRRDECRHVAETLRDRSDTSLGESLGLSMMRRLATTPAEIAAADARGRQFAWRMRQWREIAARQPRDGLGEFARLLADPAIEREQQLIDRVITTAGAPLTPPTGWEPQRPR